MSQIDMKNVAHLNYAKRLSCVNMGAVNIDGFAYKHCLNICSVLLNMFCGTKIAKRPLTTIHLASDLKLH